MSRNLTLWFNRASPTNGLTPAPERMRRREEKEGGMTAASRRTSQRDTERTAFERRYERLGEMEGRPAPRGSSRRRRTIEECIRETAEQRERGISVICRPTWEALEEAKKEIEAQLSQ